MPVPEILAPMIDADDAEASLKAAFALAAAYGGQVRALHVRQSPKAYPTYSYYPMAVQYVEGYADAFLEAGRVKAEQLKQVFDRAVAQASIAVVEPSQDAPAAGATACWLDVEGEFPMDIAAHARLADLTVMRAPDDDAPYGPFGVAEAVLIDSGRPLLLTPAAGLAAPPKSALIAWNGGAEAARAVASALPLLPTVKSIVAATVGECVWRGPDTEDLVQGLKRRGYDARAQKIDEGGASAGELLLKAAQEAGADLIIAGGYSHSRWREAILGGVTRFMIRQGETPVLLVH